MTPFKISTPGSLHPLWMRSVSEKPHHICTIADDGRFDLLGELLRPIEPMPAGTVICVWVQAGFFWGATQEAHAAHLRNLAEVEAFAKQIAVDRLQADKDERNACRKKAEAELAALAIPFEWTPAIKMVRSGLQENSYGDGHNKSTVVHLQVSEGLKAGRIERKAGELLCGGGAPKKRSMGLSEFFAVDGNSARYRPMVTCKSCLNTLQRISPSSTR